MTNDGRITEDAPYGQHISLTCRHHPTLRWSTKNIAPLGCRTIFYLSLLGRECDCPSTDLVHRPTNTSTETSR